MYKVSKHALAAALKGFRRLKLKKASLPVLGCLLFEPAPDGVTLTATNLDDSLRHTVGDGRAGEDAGKLLVPFHALEEAVKAADKGTVLGIAPGKIRIIAGDTELTRTCEEYPLRDFPVELFPAAHLETTLPALMVGALREVAIAASTDPNRHVLNGVHLATDHAVATNGRRLNIRRFGDGETIPVLPEKGITLPVSAGLNLFTEEAGSARLELVRDQSDQADAPFIRFTLTQADWSWNGKLVAGNFPDWRQVVPAEDSKVAEIELTDREAARLCELLPKLPEAKVDNAPVTLRAKAGQVTLCAGTEDGGNRLTLNEATHTGGPVATSFNRSFLLDALKLGHRRLVLRDELSPVLMRAREGASISVWMPLRLKASPAPAGGAAKETSGNPASANGSPPAPTQPTKRKETQPMVNAKQETNDRSHPNGIVQHARAGNRLSGTNGTNGHADPDPESRAQEAFKRLREINREHREALRELEAALKEAVREKKSLEKDHFALRKNIRGLQAIEV